MTAAQTERHNRGMMRLVTAVQELSLARSLESVMAVVRRAAREITGADGATFILRDEDKCHYVDEDAVGPLWKGQRFPLTACVSGWAMLHREPVVIEDIYNDPRVPVDAYRPTFVKSLVMVPIRTEAPIGAIGNYWATQHRADPSEVDLLQALANTTSVALDNVRLYEELEQRVRDRTAQLQIANRELEAFSYSVSHDLKNPLNSIGGFAGLLENILPSGLDGKIKTYLGYITSETRRMTGLIEDMLRLAQLSRVDLKRGRVNLSRMTEEMVARLRVAAPSRNVSVTIQPGLEANGDAGLLHIVLENLLANAWKYSAKREHAEIVFGRITPTEGPATFFVRDNGAGFDMKHADRLFAPFQRLHDASEFAGTGVGLATVQRIIHRHGGRIWVEAAIDCGATFYFTLSGQSLTQADESPSELAKAS